MVDICGMTQMLAALSIPKATIATNHIQMNAGCRVAYYIKLRYGSEIKGV